MPSFKLTFTFMMVTLFSVQAICNGESLLVHENRSNRGGFWASDVAFTPDGAFLIVAGAWLGRADQPELRVWSLEEQAFVAEHRMDAEGHILRVEVAPDGETLLVATSPLIRNTFQLCRVELFRWERGELRGTRLQSVLTPIRQLASAGGESHIAGQAIVSSDASLIVIYRHENGTLMQADVVGVVESSGEVVNLLQPREAIKGMTFLNDNETLAITTRTANYDSGSQSEIVEVELTFWNCHSGEQVAKHSLSGTAARVSGLRGNSDISSLQISPSGDLVAFDGPDHSVQIWNVDPLGPHLELTGFTSPLSCVQFHPQLDILAVASQTQGDLSLWDLSTGQMVWSVDETSDEGQAWIDRMDFSSNGEWLVTSGVEHGPGRCEVRLWNVAELLSVADVDQ